MVTTTALTVQGNVASVTPESAEAGVAQRRRPGRPTLLADGAGDVLLAAVRAGNRLSAAARAAGLSPSTVEEWMRRGRGLDVRPPTPMFVHFVEAIEAAQAAAEAEAIAAVRGAMGRDWKAAAWYLGNVSPDWRRHRQPPGEPPPAPELPERPQGDTISLTQEETEAVAMRLMQERSGDPATYAERLQMIRAHLVEDHQG